MSRPGSTKRRHVSLPHNLVEMCPVVCKIIYPSRKRCLTAMNHLRSPAVARASPRVPCAVYRCPHCEGWHLTSQQQPAWVDPAVAGTP